MVSRISEPATVWIEIVVGSVGFNFLKNQFYPYAPIPSASGGWIVVKLVKKTPSQQGIWCTRANHHALCVFFLVMRRVSNHASC